MKKGSGEWWRRFKQRRRESAALRAWRKRELDRIDWKCPLCARFMFESNGKTCKSWRATVDHIIPVSKGGARFDRRNLRVVCYKCNKEKGNSLLTPEHEGRRFPPCSIESNRSSNQQRSSSEGSLWEQSLLPR